jgi:hypothetical protein
MKMIWMMVKSGDVSADPAVDSNSDEAGDA